ncbi:MAG: 4Fe-4S binding protein [Candidatus Heimdallarchaeota archaeon]|nr:4Fe-4S binding protein [Candidatus Heimdallarchaeota archaeon]
MTVANKQNPYKKLTKILNTIPNGFQKTKDGTHLRLLEWIFEPEEAELASKLKLLGETLPKLSKRLKKPKEYLAELLERMHNKGQIHVWKTEKGTKYGLLPFVVGIYEEQLHRMDAEFAHLFEEYCQKTKGNTLFSTKPALHRVIPINNVIKTDLIIHPYNQAEELLKKAKSWSVRDCICRVQQKLIGNGCSYPTSVCISFSSRENAYKENKSLKPITLDEAIKVLKDAEEAGLIHSTMNVATEQSYICNCYTCCCGVLKGLVTYSQPNAFVKSDYVLKIDDNLCNGCNRCVSRCQFKALEVLDKKCVVNDKCIGCGVCAFACPNKALSLVPRDKSKIKKPPKGIAAWMIRRAIRRRKNLLKVI